MDDIINRYTLYLIKQYWEKPKAKAEIENLMYDWQQIGDFIREFGNNFDIDNAEGAVLDLIGRIVGLSRQVNEVTPINYFGFDINPDASGFGSITNPDRPSATFFRVGQQTHTPLQLQDPEYRKFLKVKIAKNNCSPFLVSDDRVSLQQVVFDAFQGRAYVVDNKDQSLTLYVSPLVSDDELRLILNLDILPRPATFDYRVVIQAEPGETFGFSKNPASKTFGSISDPLRDGGLFARIYNG